MNYVKATPHTGFIPAGSATDSNCSGQLYIVVMCVQTEIVRPSRYFREETTYVCLSEEAGLGQVKIPLWGHFLLGQSWLAAWRGRVPANWCHFLLDKKLQGKIYYEDMLHFLVRKKSNIPTS